MQSLASLQRLLPDSLIPHTQADGVCMWIVWQDERAPVLEQIFEDYGGILLAEEKKQELWFFFSNDAFLAAARSSVWGKFNTITVAIQIFPSTLQVSASQHKRLVLAQKFWAMSMEKPSELIVLVHESFFGQLELIPGLSQKSTRSIAGAEGDKWGVLSIDSRLPYTSTSAWYVVLQPVGSTMDKTFQTGWRDFLTHLEDVLQRNKFRFIIDNFFLMFKLDTLRDYKVWCRDFLTLVDWVKEEHPEHYWPCVQTIIDRKGLALNSETPKKVGIDWDRLSPDYPYMFMRNALILGDEFEYHPVKFTTSNQTAEGWCSVTLLDEGKKIDVSAIPSFVSPFLEEGEHPHCFYCGLRSHVPHDCPSRNFSPRDGNVWKKLASMSFAAMQKAIEEIDAALLVAPESLDRLAEENSPAGVMLQAYFDSSWPVQLRAISLFWRAKDKDIARVSVNSLLPEDESPLWVVLGSFTELDLSTLDKELQSLAHRYPQEYRVASISGFVAMERGEYTKAMQFWKEAEIYCTLPLLQAWHMFLQARPLRDTREFNPSDGSIRTVFTALP